jgi:uncharacterized phiE125 gp8 family phage protein
VLTCAWDDGLRWHTSLVTAPTRRALTLDEAKQQVRRTHVTDDDAWLDGIGIPAVEDRAQQSTDRQLVTATWDMLLDRFPGGRYIEIPKPPLQSVLALTYVDPDGIVQTLSEYSYEVEAPVGPRCKRGRVILNPDETWPSIRYQPNAVTLRFVAGYGATGAYVPGRLKMGMLLDLGTLYEHREDHVVGQGFTVTEFPSGSQSIYDSYRSVSRG